MATLNLPEPFGAIDESIEKGDVGAARDALGKLAQANTNPALTELLDVKIGIREGGLAPQVAMNRLLTLMRQNPKLPGAHELYKEASAASYEERHSSLAYSHPPPPMKPKDGPPK